MAWSRTEEGIHEARVAKHAFEEFAGINKKFADIGEMLEHSPSAKIE